MYYILICRPGTTQPELASYETKEEAVARLSDLCDAARSDRIIASYQVYIFIGERAYLDGYPRTLVGPGEEKTQLTTIYMDSKNNNKTSLVASFGIINSTYPAA